MSWLVHLADSGSLKALTLIIVGVQGQGLSSMQASGCVLLQRFVGRLPKAEEGTGMTLVFAVVMQYVRHPC